MKTVLWEYPAYHSLEYCAFHDEDNTITGTIILLLDNTPTRVAYSITCSSVWRARKIFIQVLRSGRSKQLSLEVDDGQVWRNGNEAIPFATGLYDVDLELTPATNTLPIRRLNLAVGQSAEVSAVWVRFPSLTLERLDQRYTRIGDRVYQYESPNFQAKIEVDEEGIVVNYEGVWRRVDTLI